MMNSVESIVIAFIGGSLLGLFFYGCLWWTTSYGLTAKTPWVVFLTSLVIRTVVTLVGFYLIGRGHWPRLILALFGFVVGRIIVSVITRKRLELNSAT